MNFTHTFLLLLTVPFISSLAIKNGTTGAPPEIPELRIIGGSYAQDGQYPYHVSIMVDGNFRCGGSLIDKSHVLSAGHCFISEDRSFNANDIKILVGHTSIRDKWDAKIIIGVDKVFVSKLYSKEPGFYISNDIAVLKLSSILDIPDNWILSLPEHKSYAGELAIATGHGLNWKIVYDYNNPRASSDGDMDGLLRQVDVRIIDNDECARAYGYEFLPKTLLCVRSGVRVPGSLCDGDSGGPLVVGRAHVGIVSSGSTSCQDDTPEIFTRVSSYTDFIQKCINETDDPNIQKIDLTYYNYQAD